MGRDTALSLYHYRSSSYCYNQIRHCLSSWVAITSPLKQRDCASRRRPQTQAIALDGGGIRIAHPQELGRLLL